MLPEGLQEEPLLKALDARFPGALLDATQTNGELGMKLDARFLEDVCLALRHDMGFDRLSSVTAVDWWPVTPRFEVVYHFHSTSNRSRLRIKVEAGEGEKLVSVTPIWKTANWYEREVFDLFGIPFGNHPNLERIMMPADWEGHPLRKDYPVHGDKYSYSEES